MEIYHAKEVNSNNKAMGDDWNDLHNIVNSKVETLVEAKTLSAGSTEILFENLLGDVVEKYILYFKLRFNIADTLRLLLNNDGTAGNYTTYLWLAEPDGNNHHLTNWDNSRTVIRVYAQTPLIVSGELHVIPYVNQGVSYRSYFSMFRAGGGQALGSYYNAVPAQLTSIKLTPGVVGTTFQGSAYLTKVDFHSE